MSDKIEIVKSWIIKADHDLGTAKITFLHIPDYLDTVSFHCQQSVEKYLKAYLMFIGSDFKFTHDLVYLIELIAITNEEILKFYDDISELQAYAVEVRYPGDTVNI